MTTTECKKLIDGMKRCRNTVTAVCDICRERQAVIDAPSNRGPWGYMCVQCAKDNAATGFENIGTRLT